MRIRGIRFGVAVLTLVLVHMTLGALCANAGPIVLGGDDLPDHGCYDGSNNVGGWLYIQKVLAEMLAPGRVTRPNDGSIAALGPAMSTTTGCPPTVGNAGAAIHYAAEVALGRTVAYYDGAAAIDAFFVDLAAGNVNPAVIWIAGTGALNNEDPTEVDAVNCNSDKLVSFINSGGAVFSSGSGNYAWTSRVVPGVSEAAGCMAVGASWTPLGNTLYPSLTSADIATGPCHTHYEGVLSPLSALANDGAGKPLLIGGDVALTSPAGMRLADAGICCGYRASVVASGFENLNAIGPLGIQPVPDGYLVTVYPEGKLVKFAGHADGQARSSATLLASYGDMNALAISSIGNSRYLTQQALGRVVEIDAGTGAVVRVVASIGAATGLVSFPPTPGHARDGHLFVSQAGGGTDEIYDVDPGQPPGSAASIFNGEGADGVCITPDGAWLLSAAGPVVNVFDTVTGAQLASSPFVCNSTDGIAIGEGRMAGKAFINCTNGEVWEWKYDRAAPDKCPSAAGPGPLRKILEGGSRGDFIAVDRSISAIPGGAFPSLLLTQTDQIVRLSDPAPPAASDVPHPDSDPDPAFEDGGWFGPPDSQSGVLFGPLVLRFANASNLAWDPLRKVDVVRGDLAILRSLRFFGLETCIMDDYVSAQLADGLTPARGNAYYYIARDRAPWTPSQSWSTGTPEENPGDPQKRDREIVACN